MKNLLLAATMTAFAFSACKNAPKAPEVAKAPEAPAAPAPAAAPASALVAEGTCYVYTLGKDVTAVQITMDGDKVSGYMDWSPDEKDGAHGFLVGTKSGNMITADWTAMIEGSTNVEQVVFKIDGDKLIRAQGPLDDKNGKMVIRNLAKAKYVEKYGKVDCAMVAKNIGAAKDVSKTLQKK